MTKFHSRFPCLAIRVGRGIIVTAASRSTSRLVWLFLCTVLLLTKKNVGHSYNLLVKYYYSTTTARSTVAGCGWRCPTDFQGSKPVWMPTTTMMMLMRQDEITIHPSLMGSLSNMAQNPTNRSRTVTSNTMSNTNNRMLMAVAATSYSSSSSNTTAKVDSRRKVMTMTLTTNEISPYYRRDRNDPFRFGEDGDADICDRSGLAKLLRERWQVRCSPLLRSSSLPSRGFSRTDKDQSGSSNSSTILGEKTASSITQRHLRTRRAQLDRRLLEEFGVRVYDHPPIWTRDDHLPAAQWRRQQWYRQRRRQQQHQKNHRRNNSTFYSIPVGPAGHPFQYVGPTRNGASSVTTSVSCSLSLPQIHNHIQYYWQYRSTENHPMAEAIRFELSLFGINIDDERMEWMITDPISGLLIVPPVEFLTNSWPEYRQRNHVTSLESDNRDHSGPMRHQQEPDTERPKEQSSAARRHRRGKGRACDDSNIAGGDGLRQQQQHQRVLQLLEQRVEAMARGETRRTNFLSLELLRTYSVLVDDTTQTWWIQSPHTISDTAIINCLLNDSTATISLTSPPQHVLQVPSVGGFPYRLLFGNEARAYQTKIRYQLSSRSTLYEYPAWKERVEHLVLERIQKREEAKYLEADAIRRELWHTYVRTVPL